MIQRPWNKPVEQSSVSRTKNDNRKIYDSSLWRKEIRPSKMNLTPFCEICILSDRLTEAKEIDHITPISEGGEPFDLDNLQSLCVSCHAKKSAKEGQKRK